MSDESSSGIRSKARLPGLEIIMWDVELSRTGSQPDERSAGWRVHSRAPCAMRRAMPETSAVTPSGYVCTSTSRFNFIVEHLCFDRVASSDEQRGEASENRAEPFACFERIA